MRNNQNFLKSTTKHDEALLVTMVNMINTLPNAKILEASYNLINVEGDETVGKFLSTLVNQVPVLDMKMYQVKISPKKQIKKTRRNTESNIYCVHFTFYRLRH